MRALSKYCKIHCQNAINTLIREMQDVTSVLKQLQQAVGQVLKMMASKQDHSAFGKAISDSNSGTKKMGQQTQQFSACLNACQYF